MKSLYEILVPTVMGDNSRPVRVRHHKMWDQYVRKFSGGLTILAVARGQWLDVDINQLCVERMIPVRLLASPTQMKQIVKFTASHYRQKEVMFYRLSDAVYFYSAATDKMRGA